MDTRKDYYRILEVGPQADAEELRQAYRVLVQRYHPEHYHMSDKTLMNARLQELNEAYEVLSNPTARSRYDRARQRQAEEHVRKGEPWQKLLLKILIGALIGYAAGLFLLRPLVAMMGLPGALMLLLAALLFFRLGVVPLVAAIMKRVLVIPLRFIGDTVLTVPLVRNLRHAFPEADIDLLASPVTAPLMETCPYLSRVLVEPRSLPDRWRLLRQGRYDAVFILRKSVTMAMMCRLAGIERVIGYDKQRFPFGYKRWGWFLHQSARYPALRTDTPQAISHLGLLTAAGIPVRDDYLELWPTEADEQAVFRLMIGNGIAQDRPLAVLHVTSASHGKQVAPDKFAPSVRRLLEAGYQVAATGTAGDAPLYESLRERHGLPLVNLAGKTSLRETCALYRKARVLLTVDSSPVHLAAAMGVPNIVGVFGPTNERQWGPHNASARFEPVFVDLPCRPCYAKVCSHNNCKVLLDGERIEEAVGRVL